MKRYFNSSLIASLSLSCVTLLCSTTVSKASNGTWIGDVDGSWTEPANWVGGIIADGPDSTAFFTADVTAFRIISLDTNRTIGHIQFSDANTGTPGGWVLSNSIIILSNSTATPTIHVGAIISGSDTTNEARITSTITGGQGYIKAGVGTLTVSSSTISNAFGPHAVRINEGAIAGFGLASVAPRSQPIAYDNGTFIYHGPNNFPNTNIILSAGTLVETNLPIGDFNGLVFGDASKVFNILLPNNLVAPNGFTTAGTSNHFMNFAGILNLEPGWKQDPTNFHIWRVNAGGGAHPYYGSSNATLNINVNEDIRLRTRGTLTTAAQRMIWGAVNGGVRARLQGSFQADNTLIVYQIGDKNIPSVFSGTIENGNNATRRTGLTKTGSSTLTLEGTNTYTGDTVIASGALILSATGGISNSPSINLTSTGSVFNVSAHVPIWTNALNQSISGIGTVVGNVAMESGGVSPGAGGIGTLRFTNNLTLSGTVSNTFKIGLNTNVYDRVLVGGDLEFNGTLPVRIAPTQGLIVNGRYILFKWTGNLVGGTANLALEVPPLPGTFTLGEDLAAKEIYLNVSDVVVTDLTWRGDTGANWDLGVTANWRNTNGNAVTFANFNHARFDNSGSNTAPVNIVDTILPLTVLFASTNDYTFTGSGKISGVASLTKNSTGKVVVTTENEQTGATTINEGILQIGDGGTTGSLGAGPVTINTNGSLAFARSDTITYAEPIVGAGTLIQNGTNGTLILTANSLNNGGILVNAGTLQLGSGLNPQGSVTTTITNNSLLQYSHDLGDVTINNTLAGTGEVRYAFASGSRTYTISPGASSPGFSGTIIPGTAVRLHVENGNAGFLLGNGSHVDLTAFGAQAWIDSSATNYNSSFTISGNGWTGDTVPAGSAGLGVLRLFNCTLTGPITMAGDSRIAGSSAGARIEGVISGGNFQLEIYSSGANVDQFILTLAPNGGANTWGNTLVTRGSIQAGGPSAIPPNLLTLTGEGRLRLNGNNVTLANILGGTPVNGTNALVLNGNATNAATLTAGSDGNSGLFEGVFGDGASQPLSLTKVGAGTMTLNAISTNSGTVTVNSGSIALQEPGAFTRATISVGAGTTFDVNGRADQTLTLNSGQTLKGNGTVSGNVVALAGSTVSPGASVGTLTVANNVTLGGTLLMELNRFASPNSDRLVSSGGTITYGGILSITNIGAALEAGNIFQLFPSGVNAFTTINIATNDANNRSYTFLNEIATLGRITVQSVAEAVNPNPTNITFTVTGGNSLNLAWPASHIGWTLQTNSVGVAASNQWFEYPAGTGSRNVNQVSITINRATPNVYFRLVAP
jgi:autotransporter-associated beta strand protein